MLRDDEWVPWYRVKGYKGSLTEDEKRHLDSIRQLPKHPATSDHLPKHVEDYIDELLFELFDSATDRAIFAALAYSAFGAYLLYLGFRGESYFEGELYMAFGAVVIAAAWLWFKREKAKITAKYFMLRENGVEKWAGDIGIRRNWEHLEIDRYRSLKSRTKEEET